MAKADLTAEVLRVEFSYSPETGVFTRRGESKASGRIATKGYRQISVCGRRYMAHRLAWLYVHGAWPPDQLDHKNRNKDDNRIDNLRVVDNTQNQENVVMWSHNTTGRRGVSLYRNGSYQADIKINGKTRHLGRFDNIIDAVAARMRAERATYTLLDSSPNYASITHDDESPLETVPVRQRPRAP